MIEDGRKKLARTRRKRRERFLLEMVAEWGKFNSSAHARMTQVGIRMGILGKCQSVPLWRDSGVEAHNSPERQTMSVSQSEASLW